jgi:hypothetical protein
MDSNSGSARFEPTIGPDGAVVITNLTITDDNVLREARHWTTGRRGEPCDIRDELASADLGAFAIEAVALGARALAATSHTSEARAVEQMLREVGDKTTEATAAASASTRQVVIDATNAVARAAADAKKAIAEADEQNRKALTTAVEGAKRDLNGEIRRVLGGERPELAERLQPMLDRFGTELGTKVQTSTGVLLDKVARQFDPADPTSPMAKHAAALRLQQQTLCAQIEKNHSELTAKVDELATTMKVTEARASLAKVTPIKGGSFEGQIHDLMGHIAAGLGEEYIDTTSTVGAVPRSKKGDGVLSIAGGTSRVVLEMTDSPRTGWGDYFDEAERNRDASAALGLVRFPEQNGGQSLRMLGSRRLVMAFDPDTDDCDLLRTVVMLLRTVAITATVRTGAAEVATAEEKIADALGQLEKIDSIKTATNAIQKNASKIDSESTGIRAAIQRLLDEALAALAGVAAASELMRSGEREGAA